MIFIDSNIPMYLIGGAHPLKERAVYLLDDLIRARRRLVTSVEVFQEICHRYCAIRKIEFIQPAFDLLNGILDQTFPITVKDIEQSKNLILGNDSLSARDALHLAVMKNLGIEELLSFDRDFDRFPWICRRY